MALSTQFGTLTAATGGELDQNFQEVGVTATLPCLITGTNALTLTQQVNTVTVTSYGNYNRFSGIVAVTNTGAVTAKVGSLSILPVYKDTSGGPAVLTGGELVAGNALILIFDSALNGGNGGFHTQVLASGGAGTVTSVGTGAGLTGGPIIGTGTISFAPIANLRLLANVSGGTAVPTADTLTAIFDQIVGTTNGTAIIRVSGTWQAVAPSAAAAPLISTATGAQYGQVVSAINAATGTNQGTAAAIGFCNLAVLTSVGAGTGIILPATTFNYKISVVNRGNNNLSVYPPSGAQIEALGANVADTVTASTGNACYEVSANNQIYRTVAS